MLESAMSTHDRRVLVLVVEDHPQHLAVIEQVLADSHRASEISAIASVPLALDFLHRRGDYSQVPRPDLILLSGQISQGKQLLQTIKSDRSLRRIPIIVLDHKDDPLDVLSSYQQQCNCYVVKPNDSAQLKAVMDAIDSFWLNIVTLPVE